MIAFLVSPSKVSAQALPFSDDFNDGNADGWEVIGNSGWNVQNGEYGIHLDPGVSNSVPSDNLWDQNWNQYIFQVDLRGVSGTDKNLVFHFIDNLNFYSLHHTGENLYFSKYINNLEYRFADPIYYPLQNGVSYRFKIIVDGDHFRVLENNLTLFDVYDNVSPKIQGGKIGLRVGTGAVSPTEVWFDNVVVESLEPPLPSLNVPNLKQYDPPWNDDVYDSATSWSVNPTIERWGCALTSASMVLKYFNHNINPDDLNNWLNSQPDGYLRSGLLNWLAVSRYTRINQDADSPILEYRRFGPDQTILENELIAGNPAILKLPGHFVVAKGKTGSDFDINDPATTRNLLSSYGESYLALNRYRATSTNLSYVMFAIDSDITLQLLDSEENLVEGSYFLDEPLVDDIDGNQTSGEELRIFLLPTPTQGNYTLEATGSGIYQLDSYLYGLEGDVRTDSSNGILQEGQIDEFLVTIGETSGAQPVVTIGTIIEDLNNSWNQGLIRKESIYRFLLRQLQLTKKFIDMNRITLAKVHLRIILTHIRLFTPKFIEQSASDVLQTDIHSLINTL